jgi:hypothetical protein
VRKIRKFKVAIHLKEILRRVKLANIDRNAAGFALDSDIAVFISQLHGAVEPGVVYELIEGRCLELSAAGIERGDMFSVCVLTLGPGIEEEIARLTEVNAAATANIILYDFLRTAATFVSDLIKEEAKKEDYIAEKQEILYAPLFSYIPEPKFLREAPRIEAEAANKVLPALLTRLNAEKINVRFEDGKILPKATIAFIMPWQRKKGKK